MLLNRLKSILQSRKTLVLAGLLCPGIRRLLLLLLERFGLQPHRLSRDRSASRNRYIAKRLFLNEGTLVPVPIGVAVVPGKGHDGLADQIEAASDDSNKKQRINSTRSADPAAAVEQPRHSQ
jgi:hypothetical protein